MAHARDLLLLALLSTQLEFRFKASDDIHIPYIDDGRHGTDGQVVT